MIFSCEPNTILDSDDWGKIRIDKVIDGGRYGDTLEIVATVLETGEQITIKCSYKFEERMHGDFSILENF